MQRRIIISLVEDGWQSARMLSLALVHAAPVEVHHYIKGHVSPSVLQMINPVPRMYLIPVPRWWFKVVTVFVVIWRMLMHQLVLVVVDKETTARRVRQLVGRRGVPVVEAQEQSRQLVYRWEDASLAADEVVHRLGMPRSCA